MTHGKLYRPVLALAVAAALFYGLAGTAEQEAAGASAPRYRYTFEFLEENVTAPVVNGAGEEGQAVRAMLPPPPMNLTGLTVVLEWRDDVGGPDRLAFTLHSPTGATVGPVANESNRGRIPLSASFAAPPQEEVVIEEASEAAAWGALRSRHPAVPSSSWEGEVTVEHAGDREVAGVVVEQDTGNSWSLAATYRAYRAVLVKTEEIPEPEPTVEPTPDPTEEPCADGDLDCNGIPDVLEQEEEPPVELSPRSTGLSLPAQVGLLAAAGVLGIAAALLVARKGRKNR